MKTVRLTTLENIAEANLVKGRLANEGIEAFVTNENFTSLMPHFNNMLGSGAHIYVFDSDYEKARQLIQDIIQPVNKDMVCPSCGSKDIGLGLGKSKVQKIFNIVLALFGGFPIGNLKPRYYCKTCKEEIK